MQEYYPDAYLVPEKKKFNSGQNGADRAGFPAYGNPGRTQSPHVIQIRSKSHDDASYHPVEAGRSFEDSDPGLFFEDRARTPFLELAAGCLR